MNVLRLKSWSERQQVLAVILMAAVVVFGLSFSFLLPLNARRARLEREIQQMRFQLASKNYLLDEGTLQSKLQDQQALNESIYGEWTNLAQRLAALPAQHAGPTSRVGHIDFKVAVLAASERLQQKSKALNISLPHEFGMDTAVRSTEDARELMLQLHALEKLVVLLFDLHVNTVARAEPLAPVTHTLDAGGEPYLEEYPVEVEFQSRLDDFYEFFPSILKPEHVFCVRRLRVEAVGPGRSDMVTVKGVLSALVFLKKPEELQPDPQPKVRYTSPLGH